MTTNRLRSALLMLLLALFLPGFSAAQNDVNGLVVFGDSLSDTGNKYFVTGFANRPPYSELLEFFLVADGPYTRGGLHHSNGATWIEQYARPRGLAGDVRPALRSEGEARNYAYGGARARPGTPVIPNANQHLPTQVMNFLADVNYSAPPDVLYVIFIGANDIFDAVAAPVFAPTVPSGQVLAEAIVSVGTEIANLAAAGATQFLVLNAPDLGLTPAIRLLDEVVSAADPNVAPGDVIAAATLLSMAYNSALDAALGAIPGVQIVDLFDEFQALVANPGDFGLSNSTDPCVMPEQPPYACKKADEYVFWDGVHPTRVTHGIIADLVVAALAD